MDVLIIISVLNIGMVGMKMGIFVIVVLVVVIFVLGVVFDYLIFIEDGFCFWKMVMLLLIFDYCVINGIGGVDFLNDVKNEIEGYVYLV